MLKQDFNKNWLFTLKDDKQVSVNLPHDFSVIQKRSKDSPAGWGNGYFPGGVGDYEKTIFVPEEWKDKSVVLEFEGVYMNAIVRVNNDIAVRQPYGYSTFHCDLSSHLKFGEENQIKVHVNNSAQPNCRWYSGSGIYRPVWLMVGEKVHIEPFGVYITSPNVTPSSATVRFETTIKNDGSISAKAIEVKSTIYDPSDSLFASDSPVGQLVLKTDIEANQTAVVAGEIEVQNPHLWSDTDPYLYKAVTEIFMDGKRIDVSVTNIGIRKLEFIPGKGFLLNGIKTYLKGGDVHHDCGVLGARAFGDAEERKIKILKENGFNAVRCSHNPPSSAFLDACDKYGILVMDEAFDGWHDGKLENDYSLYFDDWWQRDLSAMVLRDRNHPSIILWSTGNEINERDGRSEGIRLARELVQFVKKLDDTRPVTHGINEKFKVSQEFIDCHDIVSYNYESKDYDVECAAHPDRMILASENYLYDTFNYWMEAEKYPNVIGDFYWTAIDYFGESGLGMPRYLKGEMIPVYPWHQSFNSDIDLCGFKRPQSYYRDCIWGLSKKPYIAVYRPQYYGWETGIAGWTWHDVLHSWTWPGFENKPIVIEVYSQTDEIELLLNGKSLGRKACGEANKYIATFETTYVPGELKALGFVGGKVISEDVLYTTGKGEKLVLSADKTILELDKIEKDSNASTDKLIYITAELLDEKNIRIPNAENKVFFTVCGEGELIAVGSSNPKSEEMYIGNIRCLYEGRALAVIRANGNCGNIYLTAMTDGIPPVTITIGVK